MLTLTHLTHTYPHASCPALDDVTLSLSPGVYGILGPNGSGKSTMMNIIMDTLTPTAGGVTWDGTDIQLHAFSGGIKLGCAAGRPENSRSQRANRKA